MKINNHFNAPYYNKYNNNQKSNASNPGFGDLKSVGSKILKQCNCDNGSLSRAAFLFISFVFLVGSRFIESRNNDERREVLTRDIPAVALSGGGVPLMTGAAAYAITKNSGIPVSTFKNKKSIFSASLASQKQVADWYSQLKDADNPLINMMDTLERHGGNIRKVMNKFGFKKELDAITTSSNNKEIIEAAKLAQSNGQENFKVLEDLIRNIPVDNKVLKFAKNAQAYVKIGGIAITAGLLGWILPRLNILITNKKYEKREKEHEQQADISKSVPGQNENKISVSGIKGSGIMSFHNSSAIQTFKSFLG